MALNTFAAGLHRISLALRIRREGNLRRSGNRSASQAACRISRWNPGNRACAERSFSVCLYRVADCGSGLGFPVQNAFGLLAAGCRRAPQALRTAGKSPEKMKFLPVFSCGILCGLQGRIFLSGYLTMFSGRMSDSRGFIAFACVIFGMANPSKVFLSALLFRFSLTPWD